MKAIAEMQHIWDQSTVYLAACWSLPWAAPACRPLWYWVAAASMAGGVLLLLWAAWRVINYFLMLRAALRAEAARGMVADEATMQKHTWDGDNAILQTPVDAGDDMAVRIRDEIDRRRLRERGMLPPGA